MKKMTLWFHRTHNLQHLHNMDVTKCQPSDRIAKNKLETQVFLTLHCPRVQPGFSWCLCLCSQSPAIACTSLIRHRLPASNLSDFSNDLLMISNEPAVMEAMTAAGPAGVHRQQGLSPTSSSQCQPQTARSVI